MGCRFDRERQVCQSNDQLWMKKDLVKVGDEVKQSHWTAGREVDVAVM